MGPSVDTSLSTSAEATGSVRSCSPQEKHRAHQNGGGVLSSSGGCSNLRSMGHTTPGERGKKGSQSLIEAGLKFSQFVTTRSLTPTPEPLSYGRLVSRGEYDNFGYDRLAGTEDYDNDTADPRRRHSPTVMGTKSANVNANVLRHDINIWLHLKKLHRCTENA